MAQIGSLFSTMADKWFWTSAYRKDGVDMYTSGGEVKIKSKY